MEREQGPAVVVHREHVGLSERGDLESAANLPVGLMPESELRRSDIATALDPVVEVHWVVVRAKALGLGQPERARRRATGRAARLASAVVVEHLHDQTLGASA